MRKSVRERERGREKNVKVCFIFCIYRVFQKTLFYVFVFFSANTYRRERSRISTELAWQGASNDMRLDFFRYLVHEKIDISGEILTLIERAISPLQLLEF